MKKIALSLIALMSVASLAQAMDMPAHEEGKKEHMMPGHKGHMMPGHKGHHVGKVMPGHEAKEVKKEDEAAEHKHKKVAK